jgi:hypothetical protein
MTRREKKNLETELEVSLDGSKPSQERSSGDGSFPKGYVSCRAGYAGAWSSIRFGQGGFTEK